MTVNTHVMNTELDRIVAIPLSEADLLEQELIYRIEAADVWAISGENYKALSNIIDLPPVTAELTTELVVDRFKQYADEEGAILSHASCMTIFSCLPELDGNIHQMVLTDVGFWVEDWQEKSVAEMASELGIDTDGMDIDDTIESIEVMLEDMEIIHIEASGSGEDRRWLYKGDLDT